MSPDIPLGDAIATLSQPVRLWIMWLNLTVLSAVIVFLFHKQTRAAALVLVVTNLVMVLSMTWLYSQVGLVRLLGLPHLIFWTPLVIYFAGRLRRGDLPRAAVSTMLILTISLSVSLVFDAVDLVRWLLGERESLLPG